MSKEFSYKFYRSKAWRQCREGYISSVYGQCERCGNAGLILHHKIKLDASNINDTEIALNWDNLEYLCLTCHNKEHIGSGEPIAEGLMWGMDGDLIKA